MKTYVLIQEGKSVDKPDTIMVSEFSSIEQANKYIKENHDLKSKYWKHCEIISLEHGIELHYNTYN